MNEVCYTAAIRCEATGGYSVTFPDVPGAITEGDTFKEAIANAREALELILEAAVEAGEPLPVARAPEDAIPEIFNAETLPVPIIAAAPSKATRINVTIDEGLLDRVNRWVAERGQSRSAFIAEAVRRAMRDAA